VTTLAPNQAEAALGAELHALVERLFPIPRSLTGPGYRETLSILEEVSGPMERHRFATGEQVFDWEIPDEWTIRGAWIKGPNGQTVVDFGDSTLHVVGYSEPVRASLTLAELEPHLHSIPEQPDAIPYTTSYYHRTWGFCLPHRLRESLPDGTYEVCIDADLEPGHVDIGEVTIPGESDEEVLFSTYCCHPALANNELSGPVIAAHLAAWLRETHPAPHFTYRFLFLPETIGSIAYLSRFGARLRERLAAGYVITCAGDPGALTYKRSRRGDTLADRAAEHVLAHLGTPYSVVDFFPLGSDERQYCSPGFDLPVGSLMRTMYGTYAEYHTSLDDLSFVTADGLAGSLDAYRRLVETLEANTIWRRTSPCCEPQLGRRGLYPTSSSQSQRDEHLRDLLWMLSLSDGTTDLIAIAERCGRPAWELSPVCAELAAHGLLER
jgi:aminopeptidase-like protein